MSRKKQKQKPGKRNIRHNIAANQEKHRSDWLPLQPDEEGQVADRRIMRRDEQDRRLEVAEAATATTFEPFDESLWQQMAEASPFELGLVVEVSRGLARVDFGDEILVCDIRGTLIAEETGYTNIVAVGDRALVSHQSWRRGLLEEVLPRRSGLARADSFDTHLRQLLVANVDQLLIVTAWREPQIWFQMIDEYLIGGMRNHLQAVICVNKVDLADHVLECRMAMQPYVEMGHRVLFTSTMTEYGLEELRETLAGRTTVLAGLSGVGKSSLLTAVDPHLDLKTGEVSSLKSREGRHTTTQAVLHPLTGGGYVIDTPGIKDMGLLGLYPEDLLDYYPEVAAVLGKCRFRNCSHENEPGCAVQTAVSDGRILEWRFQNYQNLYDKLAE